VQADAAPQRQGRHEHGQGREGRPPRDNRGRDRDRQDQRGGPPRRDGRREDRRDDRRRDERRPETRSAGPQRRGPDPDSPFAALAALKSQLEAKGKDRS
jgi:ATP-dependent RNA helicase SUPV3L1/SUV3